MRFLFKVWIMSEYQSNFSVKISSEKSFGIVFAIFFLFLGLLPLIDGNKPRIWILGISIFFLFLAFLAPQTLKIPNSLWFKFGIFLGRIVTPISMAIVFTTTIVPVGLTLRLFGKDLLRLKLDPTAKSYWIKRIDEPQSMKYQF